MSLVAERMFSFSCLLLLFFISILLDVMYIMSTYSRFSILPMSAFSPISEWSKHKKAWRTETKENNKDETKASVIQRILPSRLWRLSQCPTPTPPAIRKTTVCYYPFLGAWGDHLDGHNPLCRSVVHEWASGRVILASPAANKSKLSSLVAVMEGLKLDPFSFFFSGSNNRVEMSCCCCRWPAVVACHRLSPTHSMPSPAPLTSPSTRRRMTSRSISGRPAWSEVSWGSDSGRLR